MNCFEERVLREKMDRREKCLIESEWKKGKVRQWMDGSEQQSGTRRYAVNLFFFPPFIFPFLSFPVSSSSIFYSPFTFLTIVIICLSTNNEWTGGAVALLTITTSSVPILSSPLSFFPLTSNLLPSSCFSVLSRCFLVQIHSLPNGTLVIHGQLGIISVTKNPISFTKQLISGTRTSSLSMELPMVLVTFHPFFFLSSFFSFFNFLSFSSTFKLHNFRFHFHTPLPHSLSIPFLAWNVN